MNNGSRTQLDNVEMEGDSEMCKVSNIHILLLHPFSALKFYQLICIE